jgi:hypothetical protein
MHVMGGRVVEVARAHEMDAGNVSVFADGPETDIYRPRGARVPPRPRGRVAAAEGDLAAEILFAGTGRLLGHSYLTGAAINVNRYSDDTTPFRAEPIACAALALPDPAGERDGWWSDALWPAILDAVRRVKAADGAVLWGIEWSAPDGADVTALSAVIAHAWTHIGGDSRGHVFGLAKRPIKDGAKISGASFHFQATRHRSAYAATGFQIAMVLGAIRDGRAAGKPSA